MNNTEQTVGEPVLENQNETGDVAETGEQVTHDEILKQLKVMIEEREKALKAALNAAEEKRKNRRKGAWRPKKLRNQKSRR